MLNKKGFTLIELMIVIAIIGILAAIIIPNLIAWLNGTHGGDSQVVEFASNETVIKSEIVEGPVIYEAGSNCSEEGKKIIEIDGVIYHLGKVKNSWGDLEAVPCE